MFCCIFDKTLFISCIYFNFYSQLDQEERSRSVEAFRKQQKDVLVATDVASKGLDFPGVQHVINYDMPDDVENYGKSIINIIKEKSKMNTKLQRQKQICS